MKIISATGREDIAIVYIAAMGRGRKVEFVESLQPPLPREKKWVLIVSTLFGCPVGCRMCDAGSDYRGKLTAAEIFNQIDYLVNKRFAGALPDVRKLKIQFARMGEPSFNPAVLDVLAHLPDHIPIPGLIPSVSSIAPASSGDFFKKLLELRKIEYCGRDFQLQFSIHSSDEKIRDWLMPVAKWDLAQIAEYGSLFYEKNKRKITLNFALSKDIPLDPGKIGALFDPAFFLIKLTPLNPTYRAKAKGLRTGLDPLSGVAGKKIVAGFKARAFEVLVSIGELEENLIGSNCGQYLQQHLRSASRLNNGYTYEMN
ncbi:MAG TPA: radical SAM protein [Patescibacteria group bacterium]|nr:radical SAM protein [Patescibacteria group bacterium]